MSLPIQKQPSTRQILLIPYRHRTLPLWISMARPTAFPTTFIIDADGNVLGYIPGGMTKDIMEDVIAQAKK